MTNNEARRLSIEILKNISYEQGKKEIIEKIKKLINDTDSTEELYFKLKEWIDNDKTN